jgi:probable rRNA maturation factor
VQYATRSRNVPSAGEFRRWIRAALKRDARITVRLVGLAEGRALNRAFRGRDYATNVLTFVLRERPPYEGDLALCAPVVSREARAQRKEVSAHYAHLTVHGVLHLQGYDHENDADALEMETLETAIMNRLGYADPYAHHARAPQ